jgi:hypothetical protein
MVMGVCSLIAMLAVSQAVDVKVTSNPEWWTYLPAAITAIAALSTFTITFAAWWRRVDDRAKEQASKVFVECHRDSREDKSMKVTAVVWNRSEGPIGHVEVSPRRDGKAYPANIVQTLPEIAPGRSHTWTWDVPPEHVRAEERQPELTFVDAAERGWQRVGFSLKREGRVGRLRRLRQYLRDRR